MEDQGKRIILFVVIAAAIFFGFTALFPSKKPEPKKPVAGAADAGTGAAATSGSPTWNAGGSATPPPATPAAPGTAPAAPVPVPVVEAPLPPAETLDLESPRMRLTLSNLGGAITRVHRLVDPNKGGLVDDDLFLAPASGPEALGLGATAFVNSTFALSPRTAWTGERVDATTARYTYRGAGFTITKEFKLLPDDWMIKLTVDMQVTSAASQQLAVSMFGIAPEVATQKKWLKKPWGKCNLSGSVKSASPGRVASGPVTRSGAVRYFGAATPFFMFALSPRAVAGETFECNAYAVPGVKDGVQIDLVYPVLKLNAGEALHKELYGYFGPSYLDKYEHADAVAGYKMGLANTIDFGWFGFISKPLLWLLREIFNVVGNWGIAIILLTILVKLATLYWTTKSMRSMRAMAALQPEMKALQAKYKDDKQKQQQAQMELFKRHGVNPLAGCLPMLLQMPIWMGLYRMLSHAGELHQAVFIPGWLDDLTVRDPFYILPIALMGLMFLQSKLQPATTTDSTQQKMMMYGMPLMFGGMGLFFPSGLTVYITTNTLLGIAHTLYMKRTTPAPKAPPVVTDDGDGGGDGDKRAKPAAGKGAAGKRAVIDAASTEQAKRPAAEPDGDADDADDDDDAGDDAGDADDGDRDDAGARPAKPARANPDRRGKRRGKRR